METKTEDIEKFPKLYNALQISEITGMHYVTITKLFKAGKIKGRKMGRTWKATEQSIVDFMNGR